MQTAGLRTLSRTVLGETLLISAYQPRVNKESLVLGHRWMFVNKPRNHAVVCHYKEAFSLLVKTARAVEAKIPFRHLCELNTRMTIVITPSPHGLYARCVLNLCGACPNPDFQLLLLQPFNLSAQSGAAHL